MNSMRSSLLRSGARQSKPNRPLRRVLAAERLEERSLLTVMPLPALPELASQVAAEVASDSGVELVAPYATVGGNSIIMTVAGTGQKGSSGDHGRATNARLNQPQGVTADAKGNFYISDSWNDRVREVYKNGEIRTIRGQGAVYGFPVGLAVDPKGTVLYVAEQQNEVIHKIDLITGEMTRYAGVGIGAGYDEDGHPATQTELTLPTDLALDKNGNLYITEGGSVSPHNRIRKVDHQTHIVTSVFDYVLGLNNIGSVAVDSNLNVYFTSSRGIMVADSSGGNLRVLADNVGAKALAVDPSGSTVYFIQGQQVKALQGGTITTIAGNGTRGYGGDGGPAGEAMLNYPADVAVDAAGNVYIADSWNHRIRKVRNEPVKSQIKLATSSRVAFDGMPWSLTATVTTELSTAGSKILFRMDGRTVGEFPGDQGIATLNGAGLDLDPGKYTFTAQWVPAGAASVTAAGSPTFLSSPVRQVIDDVSLDALKIRKNLAIYKKAPSIIWRKVNGQTGDPIADAIISPGKTLPGSGFFEVSPDVNLLYPAPAPDSPVLHWSWEIPGTTPLLKNEGDFDVTGAKGERDPWIPVAMPSLVGQYDLNIKFTFKTAGGEQIGEPINITHKLYATLNDYVYDRQGPSYYWDSWHKAPKEEWLKLVTDWAKQQSDPAVIAEKLMHGIYEYGKTHWVYQFGSQAGKSWANFLDAPPWDQQPDTKMQVNCRGLATIWDHCSRILGIGGTSVSAAYSGQYGEGYVTLPSMKLWQGKQSGNLSTFGNFFSGGAYLLDSHVVGLYGGKYYDPTFDRTGDAVNGTPVDEVQFQVTKDAGNDEEFKGAKVILVNPEPWWPAFDAELEGQWKGISDGVSRYSAYTLSFQGGYYPGTSVMRYMYVPATTTTLAASSTSLLYGDEVTFTARIESGIPNPTIHPRGVVTFYDGATVLGTANTVTGDTLRVSTATFTTSELKKGQHKITAKYAGYCATIDLGGSFGGSQSKPVVVAVKVGPRPKMAASALAASVVSEGASGGSGLSALIDTALLGPAAGAPADIAMEDFASADPLATGNAVESLAGFEAAAIAFPEKWLARQAKTATPVRPVAKPDDGPSWTKTTVRAVDVAIAELPAATSRGKSSGC